VPKLLKKRGGARPGSGQKPIGASRRIIKTIALEQRLWDAIEAYRTQAGLSRNGAVHKLLSERLLIDAPSVQMPLIDTPAPPVDDLELALAVVAAIERETGPNLALARDLKEWLDKTPSDFGQSLANELELLALPESKNNWDTYAASQLSKLYGDPLVNLLLSRKTKLTNRTFQELIGSDDEGRRRRLLYELLGIE